MSFARWRLTRLQPGNAKRPQPWTPLCMTNASCAGG